MEVWQRLRPNAGVEEGKQVLIKEENGKNLGSLLTLTQWIIGGGWGEGGGRKSPSDDGLRKQWESFEQRKQFDFDTIEIEEVVSMKRDQLKGWEGNLLSKTSRFSPQCWCQDEKNRREKKKGSENNYSD